MNTFAEVVQKAVNESLIADGFSENDVERKESFKQISILSEMMSPKYRSTQMPKVPITEALQTGDMSILFPKAVSDVLIRPREPIMIGQTLLAKTVQAPTAKSFEFPVMGSIRAFDLAEGQEYPEQQPSFAERFTEIRTNRSGVMVSVGEDVIKDAMWDIMGLMIEAAGFAMMRHKEEKIFNAAVAHGHTVFDNTVDNPLFWTNGTGKDGTTRNFSAGFDDFIDALGSLISHQYIPTDIVMHPMAWMVFAKDPILRAQFLTQGQIGQSIWKNTPSFDQSANIPWNIAYQVSPFMPIANKELKKVASGGTALESSTAYGSTPTTDIMILDRNSSIMILQKDPMAMQSWEDFVRECTKIKIRERYGVGVLNQGRSVALIKNVRLEQNFAPALTVKTITGA